MWDALVVVFGIPLGPGTARGFELYTLEEVFPFMVTLPGSDSIRKRNLGAPDAGTLAGRELISDAPAERVPNGSQSGLFQFQNFSAGSDPQFFIQPGEATVWLLSRFMSGEVATALAGGATLRLPVRDHSVPMGTQFVPTPEVGLVRVPEPAMRGARLLALCSVIGLWGAARGPGGPKRRR